MNVSEPVERIVSFNRGRDPERLARKYALMAGNPAAFMRGCCHLFFDNLPSSLRNSTAPSVWLCGDLHFENVGAYLGSNRLAYFDITDFDETLLGPVTWDLARFMTSLLVARKSLGVDRATATQFCVNFLDSFRQTLASGKTFWIERGTSTGAFRQYLRALEKRRPSAFLASRVEVRNGRPLLRIDNVHTLPTETQERESVSAAVQAAYRKFESFADIGVMDALRRAAGNGSLGLDRYALLVDTHSDVGMALLDAKEARPSAASKLDRARPNLWRDDAERVTSVQFMAQACPIAFLRPLYFLRRGWILRELQPTEDKLDINSFRGRPKRIRMFVQQMGRVVAWRALRVASWRGSASIDLLIDYASTMSDRKGLLRDCEELALLTHRQYKEFQTAYQHGKRV